MIRRTKSVHGEESLSDCVFVNTTMMEDEKIPNGPRRSGVKKEKRRTLFLRSTKIDKRKNVEYEENNKNQAQLSSSLSPALRQWSKLVTAIGTVAISSCENMNGTTSNSGAETPRPSPEDLFLKRFSTRNLDIPAHVKTRLAGYDCNQESGAHSRQDSRRTSHFRAEITTAYHIGMDDENECARSDSASFANSRAKYFIFRRFYRKYFRLIRIVSPDGSFIFYWLSLLTACVLYNWWTLIARQCFADLRSAKIWFVFDIFSDLMFCSDPFVQARTGFLEEGLLVSDAKKLARRYLFSKQFLVDAVSLTPFDYMAPAYPILRFTRLLKTYRAVAFYYMLESRTIYPNATRVANWCHILLLACHYFACFYFMVAGMDNFASRWTEWTPETVGNVSLTRKYLLSLYWSTLTLTTIGTTAVPRSNYEYTFTIISYLVGVFVFAAIVGQVGNVITNRNANRLEFERLSDGAKQYMRYHKVPKDMQRRVQSWFDYSWSRGRMTRNGDNQSLAVLPDKLKTELALRVNLDTLKKVSIFQECQPQFLHDLVLKMRAIIFTPGDIVCRKGEVAREMYIIADGVLEVLNEDGDVLRVMRAGDFFGEIGILNLDAGLNKRSADVRSVGYSELFSLSREDVLAATKDYPDAEAILREYGRQRLQNRFYHSKHSLHQSKESLAESVNVLPANTPSPQLARAVCNGVASTNSLACPLTRDSSRRWIKHPRRNSERPSRTDMEESALLSTVQRAHSTSLAITAGDRLDSIGGGGAARQEAAPSRVTNLLGCPVNADHCGVAAICSKHLVTKALSLCTFPSPDALLAFSTRRNQNMQHIQYFGTNFRKNGALVFTCDEEVAVLKNVISPLLHPEVYSKIVEELDDIQCVINCKLRALSDRYKRAENETAKLRRENDALKNQLFEKVNGNDAAIPLCELIAEQITN